MKFIITFLQTHLYDSKFHFIFIFKQTQLSGCFYYFNEFFRHFLIITMNELYFDNVSIYGPYFLSVYLFNYCVYIWRTFLILLIALCHLLYISVPYLSCLLLPSAYGSVNSYFGYIWYIFRRWFYFLKCLELWIKTISILFGKESV